MDPHVTRLAKLPSNREVAEHLLAQGYLPIPLRRLAGNGKAPAVKHTPAPRSDFTFAPPPWNREAALAYGAGWDKFGFPAFGDERQIPQLVRDYR